MNKSKIQKFAVVSTALKKETSARQMLPKFAVAFSLRLRRARERR